MEFTRREALAAAAGVVAGTAGCAGVMDDGDGGTNSQLRAWAPASEDGDSDSGISAERTVEYHDYTAYPDRSYDPEDLYGDYRWEVAPLGVDAETAEADVSVLAGASRSTVLFGSFDAESVLSEFDGDQVGEYQGATLLRPEAPGLSRNTYAVTDSAVVVGQAPSAAASTEAVRRLLDTDAGEVERAAEDADFEMALSPVESGDYVSVSGLTPNASTGSALQGVVVGSVGATLQSERIDLTQVYVYESADAAGIDAPRNTDVLGPRWESVSVESSGRTVTVTATYAPSAGEQGGQQTTTPQAQFDFEYDDDTVTVTHNGGDTFNGQNTAALAVTDGDRTGQWLPAAEDDEISTGDSFVVGPDGDLVAELTGGETISVIWTAPDGGDSQVLADFTLPE